MDAKQVDVMVADASHEVYVDKILDTIREAKERRLLPYVERILQDLPILSHGETSNM